ncbi:hypothetical protein [Spirosoma flavum]|uniref:Uncharacterized protein n=1 Tax=Spirosoma flavum TaxID=2048557 RepID=A0ABW6AP69_9BACT
MATTRVLITVKTYPTLSNKYDELVCTAGLTEAGQWIRIYPIQYRQLDYNSQYKKYDWVELDLIRNKADFRAESYRPLTLDIRPKVIAHIDYKPNWSERKAIVLPTAQTNLGKIIAEAKNPQIRTSLATFKPTRIIDFDWKGVDREWSSNKTNSMRQLNLFEQRGTLLTMIRKIPYKFRYTFIDDNGQLSRVMIEDWEIGALYWNCLQRADGDEKEACEKVGQRYFDEFVHKKDLHFFLGTTQAHHLRARNPFIIIGTFHPPKEKINPQLSLF